MGALGAIAGSARVHRARPLGVSSVVSAAVRAASKVGAIACMLASAVALAQPDAGVRIDYQVDGPARHVLSPETFIAEVHGRSPRIRISPDAPRSLVVRITRVGPAKMAGRIELHEPDGTTTERDVTGASCEEVVSALSLVAGRSTRWHRRRPRARRPQSPRRRRPRHPRRRCRRRPRPRRSSPKRHHTWRGRARPMTKTRNEAARAASMVGGRGR